MLIPNFVGALEYAGPFIVAAIMVALFVLLLEAWPDKPKWRR